MAFNTSWNLTLHSIYNVIPTSNLKKKYSIKAMNLIRTAEVRAERLTSVLARRYNKKQKTNVATSKQRMRLKGRGMVALSLLYLPLSCLYNVKEYIIDTSCIPRASAQS